MYINMKLKNLVISNWKRHTRIVTRLPPFISFRLCYNRFNEVNGIRCRPPPPARGTTTRRCEQAPPPTRHRY